MEWKEATPSAFKYAVAVDSQTLSFISPILFYVGLLSLVFCVREENQLYSLLVGLCDPTSVFVYKWYVPFSFPQYLLMQTEFASAGALDLLAKLLTKYDDSAGVCAAASRGYDCCYSRYL